VWSPYAPGRVLIVRVPDSKHGIVTQQAISAQKKYETQPPSDRPVMLLLGWRVDLSCDEAKQAQILLT
jgi:hypothetical protein